MTRVLAIAVVLATSARLAGAGVANDAIDTYELGEGRRWGVLRGVAGGPAPLAVATCAGFATREPAARLAIVGATMLEFALWSEGDTGLAVREPGGQFHCTGPSNHARLQLPAAAGTFEVYFASAHRDAEYPVVLTFADASHKLPNRAAATAAPAEEAPAWNARGAVVRYRPGSSRDPSLVPIAVPRTAASCAGLANTPPALRVVLERPLAALTFELAGVGARLAVTAVGDLAAGCADTGANDLAVIALRTPAVAFEVRVAAPVPGEAMLRVHSSVCPTKSAWSAACSPLAGSWAAMDRHSARWLTGTAGGPDDLTAVGCTGFVPREPQHRIVRGPERPIGSIALHSDGDTMLAVRAPSGTIRCSPPDLDGTVPLTEDGEHAVFVGSMSPSHAHPYVLAALPPGAQPDRERAILIDGQPRREWDSIDGVSLFTTGANTTVRGGWLALRSRKAPMRIASQLGDTTLRTLGTCTAHFANLPQYRIAIDAATPRTLLKLDGGPGLVAIRRQDGTIECVRGNTLTINPGIGTVELWLGTKWPGGWPYEVVLELVPDCDPSGPPRFATCAAINGGGSSNAVMMGFAAGAPARGVRISAQLRTSRRASLAAVVRLHAGSQLCTATVVELAGKRGLLTAAHCLFELRAGRFGVAHARIGTDRLGTLDVRAARMPDAFRACARAGRDFRECVSRGDVAFVPVDTALADVVPWSVCDGATGREVTAFGFGLDRGRLPSGLLAATFSVDARGDEPATARGTRGQQVAAGDSGGPVISVGDDAVLGARLPRVCFVVSAVAHRGRDARALLQPVTALRAP